MNKEKELLMNQTYKRFMNAGLGIEDTEVIDDIVDKKIMGFGTTIDEKIMDVTGLKKLLAIQNQQSQGVDLKWEIKPVSHYTSSDGNTALFADDLYLHANVGGEATVMYMRFSVVLSYVNNQWKVIHWHGSKPENVQSHEDTFGIENWKAKTEALEKLVAERTQDLIIKNKELEIEAALERVRSKAMAMHKSEDLKDAVAVAFDELDKLDLGVLRVGISVLNKEKRCGNVWLTSVDEGKAVQVSGDESFDIHPLLQGAFEAWLRREDFYYVLEGDDLTYYYQAVEAAKFRLPESQMFSSGEEFKRQYCFVAVYNSGGLFAFRDTDFPEEAKSVMRRFAGVFDLTYKRFLDLQKAEAQSREAHIQLSLERVRSRAMAMHKSDELIEVVGVLYKQFEQLDFGLYQVLISIYDKKRNIIEWWGKGFGAAAVPQRSILPIIDHPFSNDLFEKWENGVEYYPHILTGELKKSWEEYLFTQTDLKNFPKEVKDGMRKVESVHLSDVFMKCGSLQAAGPAPLTEEKVGILKRFTKVLDQAYTRMTDLQTAEAQAREARIEAALEKVRSRSLAMHRSEELQEVVTTVFERLKDLDIQTDAINLDVFNENKKDAYLWTAVPGHQYSKEIHIPYTEITIFKDIYDGMVGGKEIHSKVYSRELKDEFLNYVFEHTDFRDIPQERKDMLYATDASTVSVAYAKNTAIIAQRYSKNPFSDEENEVLKRFAKVFEQAYTRFLDLQKAEAQAREAQIEAALERVRAKVIGMNHSHELKEISYVFGDQMRQLGVDWQFSYFWLIEEHKDANTFWITWPDNHTSVTSYSLAEADPYTQQCLVVWKRGDKIHSNHLQQKEVRHWLNTFQQITADAGDIAKSVMQEDNFKNGVYYYDAMMKYGSFGICTNRPATEEESKLQCRFAVEFERAYTRFLDLKQAETQAKEAELEKKRSEDLLLNILPREIANELKQFGKSYARKHEQVSILFTDIKGFSTISETLSAEELVNQLDECFRAFDNIVGKYGLEKIKTIGDAYVCACGLPNPDPDNAVKTVRAALAMLDFAKGFALTKTIQDLPGFEFRFGIHTGSIITGVVGLKKFTYDIWGDAVNMAARMEQHGEAGKINVSGNTYQLIKEKFNCTHRGKIAAKNKGEVDMYFVEGTR